MRAAPASAADPRWIHGQDESPFSRRIYLPARCTWPGSRVRAAASAGRPSAEAFLIAARQTSARHLPAQVLIVAAAERWRCPIVAVTPLAFLSQPNEPFRSVSRSEEHTSELQ